MKNGLDRGRPFIKRAACVTLLYLGVGCAGVITSAIAADSGTVKTFDLLTYTEPPGFEPSPAGSDNHVSFRRVEPGSWILFSVYGNRAAPGNRSAEFAFDWNDISSAAGVAAPTSRARTVGTRIEAREGGTFVPSVGYIDLVDVYSRGRVASVLIKCGSADQYDTYRPLIETFLASLILKGEPKRESAEPAPAATARQIEFVKDGFIWTGANGLEYIPAVTRVGEGACFPASIPGIWQEDRQQFTLELASDGTYASAYGGGSSSGSFQIHESGRWKADGTKLRLRPESASRFSRGRTDLHGETANVEAGGLREYEVTTLVLEYSRNNQTYRVDGLELSGAPAPWFYTPDGKFLIVLRRTGDQRVK